jgi:formylglycine-generating enzyme required for sulfatase activity
MARSRHIPQDIRDKLLVDAMHRCCLCPEHADITDVHHIIPISEDGPNTEENLIVVCPNCHRKIHSIRNRYPARQLRMYKERWRRLCAWGLPLETRLVLASDVDHESTFDTLLTADPQTITRDAEGNIHAGDAILSAAQMEALRSLLAALPDNTPDEARRQLAAATSMVSEDLVPPADFAARAQEYARRQRAQRGDLAKKEEEEAVYIPLQLRFFRSTRAAPDDLYRREEEPTFDDILDAVDAPQPRSDPPRPFPAMVLLGEPGSGKSTSLRHLARAKLQSAASDPASSYLPLFVNLGDHASGSPTDFLDGQWRHWYGTDDLTEVMEAGRLWLLADGLNEMTAADERDYEARVRAWRSFFNKDKGQFPPGNRALVACRSADYGTGLELPRLQVEPMDDERIADFVARRFWTDPERGEGLLAALQADRQARGDEHGLYGLARNPFWLVMLVDVCLEGDQLPRNRAQLAQRFVERWLAYEADRLPDDQVLTGQERTALQIALDALAFASLGRGQNTPQPQAWVLRQLPREVEVSGFRETLRPETTLRLAEAACLLECRGPADARTVRFYHQLLLEHFAGRELLRRFQDERATPLSPVWRIPWAEKWQFVESAWDPLAAPPTTGWEETTALAAARAALLDAPAREDGDWPRLAQAVLPHNPPLAARCLLEAGVSPLPEAARVAVTDHLLAVIENPAATADLDPRQRTSLRIACGKALGHLGDPRIVSGERRTPDGARFILPPWSRVIPAGTFLMGSRRDDPDAYGDEYSQATGFEPHRVDIPYDYVVGCYPVTNAEYACFFRDGGYQKEEYWETENARAWLRGELDLSGPWVKRWRQIAGLVREGQLAPDEWLAQRRISPAMAETYKWAAGASDQELEAAVRQSYGAAGSGQRPTQPRYWDDPRYNTPSQPVVGMCWFEAMAYCAWLSQQLRVSRFEFRVRGSELVAHPVPQLETGNAKLETLRVRLPSEAEWEKAARWDGAVARRYPWGEAWDEARANTLEGRVLTTTPVGVYPEGASPCGALDMAGNVWEWTRSRWGAEVDHSDFGYPYRLDDDREAEESTGLRVVRGGSWNDGARLARAAYRGWGYPDGGSYDLGVRLVLQLS